MVQPRILDGSKVILRDPCLPVILQNAQRLVSVLYLPERVFVYDVWVVRVLENAWCYPWL